MYSVMGISSVLNEKKTRICLRHFYVRFYVAGGRIEMLGQIERESLVASKGGNPMTIWGKQRRYSAQGVQTRKSVQYFFVNLVVSWCV